MSRFFITSFYINVSHFYYIILFIKILKKSFFRFVEMQKKGIWFASCHISNLTMNVLSELIRLLRGAWGFAVLRWIKFHVAVLRWSQTVQCAVTKIPSRCCGLLFDTFDRLTRTLVGLVELSKPIYIRQTVLCNFLGKRRYQICQICMRSYLWWSAISFTAERTSRLYLL